MSMWKVGPRLRVADDVGRQLQDDILSGRYRAGEKLPPERRLAESLGINRGTLREALKRLEHMGLVRSRQGDGTRVLDFLQTAGLDLLHYLFPVAESGGLTLLKDILEFRQIVGREVARLAAERAAEAQIGRLAEIAARPTPTIEEAMQEDLDFYVELARATDNTVFILLLNTVRVAVRSFSGVFSDFNPEPDLTRRHHQEIVAALQARDSAAAAEASHRHLLRGKEHLMTKLDSGPEVVAPPSTPE